MRGIKLVSMGSTIRLGERVSCTRSPISIEVKLGEHGQRHEVQSSDEVGHEGHQIDQHSR